MNKEKTMVEIYRNDLKDLHFIKISASAKNIPDVLHEAVLLLKKEMEKKK